MVVLLYNRSNVSALSDKYNSQSGAFSGMEKYTKVLENNTQMTLQQKINLNLLKIMLLIQLVLLIHILLRGFKIKKECDT